MVHVAAKVAVLGERWTPGQSTRRTAWGVSPPPPFSQPVQDVQTLRVVCDLPHPVRTAQTATTGLSALSMVYDARDHDEVSAVGHGEWTPCA
jgi:hypothetical protein